MKDALGIRGHAKGEHSPGVLAGAVACLPEVLLITQVFPPTVGGSGVLLENVYARLAGLRVTVVTDRQASAAVEQRAGKLVIRQAPIDGRHCGLASLTALRQHAGLMRVISSAHLKWRGLVHCGRAVPEGVPAYLARCAGLGPKYLFWAHGEDVTTTRTSRELSLIMSLVYRGASAAIANSLNTQRVLKAAGMPEDRIHVVYPGVDTTQFSPAVEGEQIRRRLAKNDELLLLSVGRLQLRKGHDLVLAALAKLRARLLCRYVIVGDGEERARLEGLTDEYGLRDVVTFAGEVPASDIPRYFAACDIFLMPNRRVGADFEGFGIVFLEAAAAEKPAIGGRSGGVSEAIEDGTTGRLVEGTDPDELAAAIWELASSSELRRRIGAAARARVLKNFTWERAAAAVREVHLRVASEPWLSRRQLAQSPTRSDPLAID